MGVSFKQHMKKSQIIDGCIYQWVIQSRHESLSVSLHNPSLFHKIYLYICSNHMGISLKKVVPQCISRLLWDGIRPYVQNWNPYNKRKFFIWYHGCNHHILECTSQNVIFWAIWWKNLWKKFHVVFLTWYEIKTDRRYKNQILIVKSS